MSTRLRLVRDDGGIFLERWGLENKFFGLFIHKMEAPDPGVDLHNHPWKFTSLVLSGGYSEQRSDEDVANLVALMNRPGAPRGKTNYRSWLSFKKFRLHEAHRIVHVQPKTWTLVLRGRAVRPWGFFTPDGYMTSKDYEQSQWGLSRHLTEDDTATTSVL